MGEEDVPGGVDAVLVGDDLPELGADLVAALAALDVHDLTHGLFLVGGEEGSWFPVGGWVGGWVR